MLSSSVLVCLLRAPFTKVNKNKPNLILFVISTIYGNSVSGSNMFYLTTLIAGPATSIQDLNIVVFHCWCPHL